MNRRIVLGIAVVLVVAGVALTEESRLVTYERVGGPVTVTNWPVDTNGDLRVAEQGQPTVQVANLPAVQQVSGEVSISNLPAPAPGFMVVQVPAIPGPTLNCGDPCRNWTSGPFDTAGWKMLAAQVVYTSTEGEGAGPAHWVAVRNFPNDPFTSWSPLNTEYGYGMVTGAQAIVQSTVLSDVYTVSRFTIYLSR